MQHLRDTRETEKTPRLMLLLTNGPHGASEPSAVRCDTVAEPTKELLAVFGDILCILELIQDRLQPLDCLSHIQLKFRCPPLAEDRCHNAQAYHRASHQA
jgi:hypothetical protein